MRNCGCVGVGVVGLNMGVKQVLTVPRFISGVHFRNWEAAAEEVLISIGRNTNSGEPTCWTR